MGYVVGLGNDDSAEHTIDRLNGLLGVEGANLAGSHLMEKVTCNATSVGFTCIYHWSFAPSSLWSGET